MTQLGNTETGERPLTARSIVASALLGTHPPVLRGQLLVRLGELFGVAEGTTRVALSRMVAAGELDRRRRPLPVEQPGPARPPGGAGARAFEPS